MRQAASFATSQALFISFIVLTLSGPISSAMADWSTVVAETACALQLAVRVDSEAVAAVSGTGNPGQEGAALASGCSVTPEDAVRRLKLYADSWERAAKVDPVQLMQKLDLPLWADSVLVPFTPSALNGSLTIEFATPLLLLNKHLICSFVDLKSTSKDLRFVRVLAAVRGALEVNGSGTSSWQGLVSLVARHDSIGQVALDILGCLVRGTSTADSLQESPHFTAGTTDVGSSGSSHPFPLLSTKTAPLLHLALLAPDPPGALLLFSPEPRMSPPWLFHAMQHHMSGAQTARFLVDAGVIGVAPDQPLALPLSPEGTCNLAKDRLIYLIRHLHVGHLEVQWGLAETLLRLPEQCGVQPRWERVLPLFLNNAMGPRDGPGPVTTSLSQLQARVESVYMHAKVWNSSQGEATEVALWAASVLAAVGPTATAVEGGDVGCPSAPFSLPSIGATTGHRHGEGLLSQLRVALVQLLGVAVNAVAPMQLQADVVAKLSACAYSVLPAVSMQGANSVGMLSDLCALGLLDRGQAIELLIRDAQAVVDGMGCERVPSLDCLVQFYALSPLSWDPVADPSVTGSAVLALWGACVGYWGDKQVSYLSTLNRLVASWSRVPAGVLQERLGAVQDLVSHLAVQNPTRGPLLEARALSLLHILRLGLLQPMSGGPESVRESLQVQALSAIARHPELFVTQGSVSVWPPLWPALLGCVGQGRVPLQGPCQAAVAGILTHAFSLGLASPSSTRAVDDAVLMALDGALTARWLTPYTVRGWSQVWGQVLGSATRYLLSGAPSRTARGVVEKLCRLPGTPPWLFAAASPIDPDTQHAKANEARSDDVGSPLLLPCPVNSSVLLIRAACQDSVHGFLGSRVDDLSSALAQVHAVASAGSENLLANSLQWTSRARFDRALQGAMEDNRTMLELTATTRASLHLLTVAVSMRIPVLLVAGTGVGKTAVLEELARIMSVPKFRINLSSFMTRDDLLGKTVLESGVVVHRPGDFATAFEHGGWVILDEMNLVRREVLTFVEQVLDDGVLHVRDGEHVERVVPMHPTFRLFATQVSGACLHRSHPCRGPHLSWCLSGCGSPSSPLLPLDSLFTRSPAFAVTCTEPNDRLLSWEARVPAAVPLVPLPRRGVHSAPNS